MGRGNESLIVKFGPHDQDGRHAHSMEKKNTQNYSTLEPADDFYEIRYVAFGTQAYHSLI